MKILHVAAEMYPLLKTGGLADVVGALPFAQQQQGQDVRVLLPAHPTIMQKLPDQRVIAHFDTFAGAVSLCYAEFRGLALYLLDVPRLFARHGNPYHDADYNDYPDNYLRFALLAYAGAEIAAGRDNWWQPEVVHAHDWHAGLTCAYLKHRHIAVKSLFTIHNIAYQGLFARHHLAEIALPDSAFDMQGMEFHGQLSYLKAGIYYADQVTTVSPTFAREITQESHAFGLHGLLQTLQAQGRLHGILNGMDDTVWNPKTDTYLSTHYQIGAMQGKAKNKHLLLQRFALPTDKKVPLFVMVTRLTLQKGVDLLLDNIKTIVEKKGQVVILGSGAVEFEQALAHLAKKYPKNVGVFIGYAEDLSHLLIAGGDVIVVPSRFEPCGLTQLYGLKYGTLPLVRHTGGLADTVTDTDTDSFKSRTATGFVFADETAASLTAAIRRVFALWQSPRKWSNVRANAMRKNFTWASVAEAYEALYRQA